MSILNFSFSNFVIFFILLFVIFLFYNISNSKLIQNPIIEEKNLSSYSVATFAGGCFWCSEAQFEKVDGVIEVISGFAGGIKLKPTYREVSSGKTKYREAVQVYYDSKIISYEQILDIYWHHINPQDIGGQFVDRGFQYSPAIFYNNLKQKELAENSKNILIKSKKFKEILVPIIKFTNFYSAEEYHQNYYKKNSIRYKFYRSHSGRDQFIEKYWKKTNYDLSKLTKLQYEVTQNSATEKPFDNAYWNNTDEGIYVDIISGIPLFSSKDKFKSGTGWPSFTKPIENSNIILKKDYKLLIPRTEVRTNNSNSHLGHLFNDGPKPDGTRYCLNSAALKFISKKDLKKEGYQNYLYLFE